MCRSLSGNDFTSDWKTKNNQENNSNKKNILKHGTYLRDESDDKHSGVNH